MLIGFYGADKQLAALLPVEPDKYKIVTRDNPDGLILDDDQAEKLSKDAFMCYAGLPARELKVLDLLKFMFNQCWKADYKTIIATSLIASLIPLVTPLITETLFADIIDIGSAGLGDGHTGDDGNGLYHGKGLISGEFVGTLFSFVFSFWSIFLMCYYSIKLTMAAIGVWLVYSIFVFLVYRRIIEFNRQMIRCANKTAGTVQQIKTITRR